MPFETGDDSDGNNENFNLVLRLSNGGDIVTSVPVTIRDVSRPRTHTISSSSPVYSPPRRPTSPPGGTSPSNRLRFPYPITVQGQPLFMQAPGNLDLQHNVPNLEVLIDGNLVPAGFKSFFIRTGRTERWGFPTSEVLVLENGALTQFYQRGVVDFHNVQFGWVVERRLAWDYVGGDRASIDQGVETDLVNRAPGELIGAWNLKVSNYSVEGIEIGFADFFNRLKGVAAFGFPKTQARVDRDFIGRLRAPATHAGFIRQYFQAAVMEFHPGDPQPVKLSLLGDTLRNILVPDFERQRGFAAARPLIAGSSYNAPLIS